MKINYVRYSAKNVYVKRKRTTHEIFSDNYENEKRNMYTSSITKCIIYYIQSNLSSGKTYLYLSAFKCIIPHDPQLLT